MVIFPSTHPLTLQQCFSHGVEGMDIKKFESHVSDSKVLMSSNTLLKIAILVVLVKMKAWQLLQSPMRVMVMVTVMVTMKLMVSRWVILVPGCLLLSHLRSVSQPAAEHVAWSPTQPSWQGTPQPSNLSSYPKTKQIRYRRLFLVVHKCGQN